MNKFILVGALLVLTGCGQTAIGDQFRAGAAQRLKDGANAFGDTSVLAVCDGLTTGYVRRNIAPDPAGMAAWDAFCSSRGGANIKVTP